MALPTSGQITMAQIRNEFGGGPQASLSQYYRGGARVPDISRNAGVPTSGQISLSDFYGAGGMPIQLSGNYALFATSPGHCGLRVTNTGVVQTYNESTSSWSTVSTWMLEGTGADYEFQSYFPLVFSDDPNVSGTGITGFGNWVSLSSTRTMTFTTASAVEGFESVAIQIRTTGDSGTLVGSLVDSSFSV